MSDTIYELSGNLIDPRFDGFRFKPNAKSCLNGESLLEDFDPINGRSINWKTKSLKKKWKIPELWGPVPSFHDYPATELVPCFSQRAVDALRDVLEPNGELLPAKTKIGTYYLYNILTVSDALVASKSTMTLLEEPKPTAMHISHFVFNKTKLKGLSIFRIRERPIMVFVTQVFVDRANEAGLNGMMFDKVWPFPKSISWETVSFAERRKLRSKANTLKGESMLIDFGLENTNPTKQEERLAKKIYLVIEKLLANQLNDKNPQYLGLIENAQPSKGRARFEISCPNAENLFKFLEPHLEKLRWDRKTTVTIRKGNLYDRKVKSKVIRLKSHTS